ncbi:hypothetical protein [Raineyella sp. W15-4]|uniref:hypothetical protein n=1 Tax=Raineyella sp. W15-4 TaxID=3081651 RepID=UPI0029540FAE|nr:hypothetical protein [Raineyella sp. W15-4]WOQ17579.1 hypothetical protein R0145_02370 [Raineyella sp. W15-4]
MLAAEHPADGPEERFYGVHGGVLSRGGVIEPSQRISREQTTRAALTPVRTSVLQIMRALAAQEPLSQQALATHGTSSAGNQ